MGPAKPAPTVDPPLGGEALRRGITPPTERSFAAFRRTETRVSEAHGSADLERDDLLRAGLGSREDVLGENLSETFDPEKYDDTYRKELLALLKEKAETGRISGPREKPEEAEVVDLMAALRESVERTKQQRKRKTAPKRKTASTGKAS